MPYNPNMRVLVVDDFSTMRRIVRNILRQLGFNNVVEADDGTTAWEVLNREKVEFIVSDWNMPQMTGIDLLRKVRASEQFADIPFLMVTAEAQQENIIEAVQAKVSNYIVKPFSPREVVSRIKAVLRRTCAAPDTAQDEKLTTLTYGSLEIQPERYSVKLAGQSVACTPREVELLYLLASHPGRVFDREQILSRIWGYDFFGDTRTVDTHIKRLRQKLTCEEMGQKWDIITVYGVGYKFEVET